MITVARWARSLSGALLAVAVAAATACTDPGPAGGFVEPPPTRPVLPATYRPSGHGAAGDVFVHLFEWKWTDIANECETVLGPAGYDALQVSPPNEHSVQTSGTWSERYQPVSYSVARSRSGTGAEFTDMVNRCKAVGVGIYVDAIINHMTNTPSPGTGSNGTEYTKYSYPGLYTPADFHTPCGINDYNVAAQVQDCELFGLPDLNTGKASVRQTIANYLIAMARLGVAGFRIDAAKHIQPVELDSIFTIANNTLVAEGLPRTWFFGEVIDYGGNEAVRARDYYGEAYASGGASDITEFKFHFIGNKFSGVNGEHISQLNPNGTAGNQFSEAAWGLMPSDKAVVFLENHDTQRNDGIGYRDGATFRLANVFMLAQPYGYPSIMSSYAFDRTTQGGREAGPPGTGGVTSNVVCASSLETATAGLWVCEHRDPYIKGMVKFRSTVAGTAIENWWDNGANAIAFSRGDKGFVAINHESTTLGMPLATGLAAGTYCDVLTGGKVGSACVGTSVVVDGAGSATLSLGPQTAIAIHLGAKL